MSIKCHTAKSPEKHKTCRLLPHFLEKAKCPSIKMNMWEIVLMFFPFIDVWKPCLIHIKWMIGVWRPCFIHIKSLQVWIKGMEGIWKGKGGNRNFLFLPFPFSILYHYLFLFPSPFILLLPLSNFSSLPIIFYEEKHYILPRRNLDWQASFTLLHVQMDVEFILKIKLKFEEGRSGIRLWTNQNILQSTGSLQNLFRTTWILFVTPQLRSEPSTF